jgi:hypothetical protein
LGVLLVSALSIPIGENGTIPLLTLTLTIMSMQLQNKQPSRQLHVHATVQPPEKNYPVLDVKCTHLNTVPGTNL